MHRLIPTIALPLALAAGSFAAPALAHQDDATPAAEMLFADTLGLPELTITATDDAFEGVPEDTTAGRYVVTFTNDATSDAGVDFLLLPEGRTVADLSGAAAAVTEGSPAAGGEGGDPLADLAWLYETYVAGGVGAGPGGTVQAIVDLRPGECGVWADDPAAQAPVAMTVTGEMPADLPQPDAAATITEVGTAEGYAFEVAGQLATGPQTVRIDNKSDQPHFVVLIGSPRPITMEQVEQLLRFDPESSATPQPGMPDPEAFTFPGYAATQSAGTTQWLATDLEPGYYVLACFVPDPEKEGIPHAVEGMVEIVEVGEA